MNSSNNTNTFFQKFIGLHKSQENLIVQPRMGFSKTNLMSLGLRRVKNLNIPVIGTITLDSFTRLRDFESARNALVNNQPLNGYPIVSYEDEQNRKMLNEVRSHDFPIQVRHGSPLPEEVFKSTINSGIDAIEGGPISYCLPYSRVPLNKSIEAWEKCCKIWVSMGNSHYHLESFGGCMMGQLCPPSVLIAISILEVIFFNYHGIESVSMSLAQGTNSDQDLAALKVVQNLAEKYLKKNIKWHVVFYTFMGQFPLTFEGSRKIIIESAKLAKLGGAGRLIVKTVKEAHQIPNIEDNLNALKWTHQAANCDELLERKINSEDFDEIYNEADCLIQSVLDINHNPGIAIEKAFSKGILDIPFCLHPNNTNEALAYIDAKGKVQWLKYGNMPLIKTQKGLRIQLTSQKLLEMLSFNQRKYDQTLN